MIAVSGVIVFAGYQLVVYGWSQLQGQNAGFFDILWPGRYKGNTPDKGSATSSPPPTKQLNSNPKINTMLNNVPPLPGTVP